MAKALKRIVGIGFGVATVIGSSVGIGIFKWPGTIATYSTNELLFISFWIIGGLLSLIGCFIYAELGTKFPIAGGPFVFGRAAFGNAGGFLTGWMDLIMNTSAIAYLAIAVIEYLNQIIGYQLHIGFTSCILIILLAIFQWQGLRKSSALQIIMSLAKTICLLVFVGACFVYFIKSDGVHNSETKTTTSSIPLFTAIILSLRAVFLAYTGWNSAIYFSEEDVNPGKNLPRSMAYGIISIIILYVLVNLGLMAVLPLHKMAGSDMAAADAAKVVFGNRGSLIVTVIGIISILGVLYATMLFTPRVLFAISKAGLIHGSLSTLNKNAIPGIGLIIITLISLLFASTGLFFLVVSISAVFGILIDLLVYISYLVVRNKKMVGYKAWGYPFNAVLMIIVSLGLIIGLFVEDLNNSFYSLILLAAGIIVYFLSKRKGLIKPIQE